MVPAFSTATQGVDPREAGIASATVNTAQQIGGSLGTALLNSIAASATAGYLFAAHPLAEPARAQGLVYGYSIATAWSTAILVLGAVVAAILNSRGRPRHALPGPTPVIEANRSVVYAMR